MGRGGRGGRRGFWTRPRAAGESMEEVIYVCTEIDSFSEFFGVFPIDFTLHYAYSLPMSSTSEALLPENDRNAVQPTNAFAGSQVTRCSEQAQNGTSFCQFIWCRNS